jgi:plasmid stabilization system protein ParE
MIVHITAEAEGDLETIADYVAQDNPVRALTFVQELRAVCLGLSEFPNRFPLVERYAEQGIRHRVHGNYMIFYRAEPDSITVLHVLHGAMDYTAIVGPEL